VLLLSALLHFHSISASLYATRNRLVTAQVAVLAQAPQCYYGKSTISCMLL
jgi:hypothetical protein